MTKIDVGWVDSGHVDGHFAHSIAHQIADMQYFGALGGIHAVTGESLVAHGRNKIVATFLQGDSDYLWMVDTDMVFDKGHWLKLLDMAEDMEADMVSGLAFIVKFPSYQLVPSIFYPGEPPLHTPDTLVVSNHLPESGAEVAATGLASSLVHRRVFENMVAPRHSEYRWFDQIVLPSGQLSGEDTQFFVRARNAGYTLRICTEALTWHVKRVGFSKEDFVKQQTMLEQLGEEE